MTTSSSLGVRETAVTFLIQNSSGLQSASRVFDLEIDESAQVVYTAYITRIQNALDGYIYDPVTKRYVPTTDMQARVTAIANAMKGLSVWSQYKTIDSSGNEVVSSNYLSSTYPDSASGIPIGSVDSKGVAITTVTSTMNRYMAENFDRLVRIFRAAGWDPVYSPTDSASAITAIGNLTSVATASTFGVADLLTKAISDASAALLSTNAFSQSQSIQQLLMVDYISRGNQLLYSQMTDLRDAIDINQQVLSYLNSLQDLMNQKDPAKFLLQLQFLSSGTTDYEQFEKSSFNQELGTIPKFSEATIQAYVDAIRGGATSGDTLTGSTPGVYVDLNNNTYDTNALTNQGNKALTRIIQNLDFLLNRLNGVAGSEKTALGERLTSIKTDLQALMPPPIGTGTTEGSGIVKWVTDYGTGREGDYQRKLSDAVTASQALNDTKREELSRVMFVYEEFYKSATAILSRLTQLIERIAGAISR
jgi:hypothetical protein